LGTDSGVLHFLSLKPEAQKKWAFRVLAQKIIAVEKPGVALHTGDMV